MNQIPELGQLVRVRQRLWSVSEIQESTAGSTRSTGQHLVELVSVEEDSFDESLRVIWQIEPAARILETGGLPDPTGLDQPEVHRALLDAVRWGSVTNADFDSLQAPFRSGIEIEDYQLDPVVRALSMPRTNLLLADDVGLGKTIEAGLVLQELLLRHRARTCLIVCPSSLQIKWQEEMRDKFGLEFRIVDTDAVKEVRRSRGLHVNPFSHFPRLITSIDWLKRPGPIKSFMATVPQMPSVPRKYDVLIVDEAHNVAPTATRNYVHESDRTRCIRRIGPHFEHSLFLTATPHNGYPISFSSMLELLDDRRFHRGVEIDPGQLASVMVRRLKSDIKNPDGTPRFAARKISPILVDYDENDRGIHELLARYTELRQKRAREAGESYATEFVLQLLKKRLFSSPAAFAATLEKHFESRTNPKNKSREGRRTSLNILRRMIADTDEESADDAALEESLDDVISAVGSTETEIDDDERELLDKMRTWGELNRNIPDSRANALIRWLTSRLKPEGEWNEQRIVIFTEYRATQNWMIDVLTSSGLGDNERLMMLYGGMDPAKREEIKAAFQASPSESPVRVLIATDAASEGIDLQNYCSLMVHLEIPWNPNRLEQRNGRIDRHGQKAAEVEIFHFLPKNVDLSRAEPTHPSKVEGDAEFLYRAALKVNSIRQDLGRVGPVLTEQITEAMSGERSAIDTASAERAAASVRSVLRVERDVNAQLKRLNDRLLESRESQGIGSGAIKNLVEVGLDLAGRPELNDVDGSGSHFRMPPLDGSWAKASEGLEHPHTRKVRPVVFDPELVRGKDDSVLIHLSHPLSELSQRLLRAELWAPESQRRLSRFTARRVGQSAVEGVGVVAHARLVVIGDRGQRLHEEVTESGGFVRNGRFARVAIGEIRKLFSEPFDSDTSSETLSEVQRLWESIGSQVKATIDARSRTRLETLENTLSRRSETEIAEVRAVYDRLRRSIDDSLKEPIQYELWTDREQEERNRYADLLNLRLERLPLELERETENVRARYASPRAFTFPISVTFVFPQGQVN